MLQKLLNANTLWKQILVKKSLNIHIANLVVKRDKINELNAQSTLLHLKLTMLQNITRKSNPPMK